MFWSITNILYTNKMRHNWQRYCKLLNYPLKKEFYNSHQNAGRTQVLDGKRGYKIYVWLLILSFENLNNVFTGHNHNIKYYTVFKTIVLSIECYWQVVDIDTGMFICTNKNTINTPTFIILNKSTRAQRYLL